MNFTNKTFLFMHFYERVKIREKYPKTDKEFLWSNGGHFNACVYPPWATFIKIARSKETIDL